MSDKLTPSGPSGTIQSVAFSGISVYYTPPRAYAPTYRRPVYPDDVYERVTTATTQAIVDQPGEVTARLVRDLTWSVGTTDHHAALFEAQPPTRMQNAK